MTPIYTGIFLNEENKLLLLNSFPALYSNVYAHHLTLAFRPDLNNVKSLPLGEEVEITVIGLVQDDKGQAALMETSLPCTNKYPHITISTNIDIAPKYSNELFEKVDIIPTKKLVLKGKVGFADENNQVHYII